MAEYTRYSVEPEDIPRRRRGRQKKKAKSRSRVWLVVKLFIVALLLALIAGLAVAAGAIYALSRDLPSLDNLRRNPQAVNTVVYDVHGKTIAVLHGAENRTLVGKGAIPDVMKEATVAVEDSRFYEHHGVDFQGVARAILENIRAGGVVQGGSTITEQYVKNAYVGNERTYTRKIREAVLAWQLEDKWSKDKILTEYLNTVYYGAGAYGVEAASLTYFHKHVSQLNLQEAALLAAIPKFPSEYTPTTDAKMAKQRRDLVLQLMATQGYITQERADRAMKTKLHVYQRPLNQNNSMADYFVSYVTSVLTKRFGSAQVFTGGMKVYTSIDMKWQQQAMDIIRSTTAPLNFGFKPSAALVAIDPANGYIRTMVGGLDYKKQKFNLASQAQTPGGLVDEAHRARHGRRPGDEPRHHLLLVQEPDHHPDGRLRRAVGGQRGRPRRARERLRRHHDLGQRRLRAAQRRRRPGQHGAHGAQDGRHQPARRRTVHHPRHLGRHAAGDGRRLRHPRRQRHPPQAAGDRAGQEQPR